MLNSLDLDNDTEDYLRQEDDEFDEIDEDEVLHKSLDSDIREIKRLAFESCISDIEADDDHTLINNIWSQIQRYAQKPYFKEAVIITAIFMFRAGLFMAYRAAKKQGLEIVDL